MRLAVLPISVLLYLASAVTGMPAAAAERSLKDLFFGEALYYAHQEEYFDAISRLDTELAQYYGLDEPNLNSLYYHIDSAEFSVGDFELYYRMHTRAGRAIKAVIEGNVEEAVRNEAIYRLARIYYQKQQHLDALNTIEKLQGRVPERIRYEEPFLRAQIYMATGRFNDAIRLLKDIEGASSLTGYAGYNLGVALFLNGNEQAGISQLDKVGRIPANPEHVQAMRDKANLVLGFRLLEADQPALARQFLQRVRLSGPFSNKALLGAGWAAAANDQYDRALVPWTILAERNVTDQSVQEVMLGVPYAYSQLGFHGNAALLYGQALEAYGNEVDRLDASIISIREGNFLKAVVREELKQDKNWLVNLRELPDTPETYYLTEMMAAHDFQALLRNYFDLTDLDKRLERWLVHLDAYEDIIKIRAAYYEPLLPEVEAKFRAIDSVKKLRIEQRDKLDKRLKNMLVSPRPDFLMSVDERLWLLQIGQLETRLGRQGRLDAITRQRIERLRGVINWKIHTEYHDRFTEATQNLRELDQHIDKLNEIYQSFVRTRQAATQSYKGYAQPIQRLRIKIGQARERIELVKARQGHMIETMAINELELRRRRLEEFQVKARFAMAESYDHATRAQQEQLKEAVEP